MKTASLLLLLSLPAAGLFALNWTPDGAQILEVAGDYPRREVFVVNADGSGRRFLTSNGLGHEYPVLSPDGSVILFSSYRSGKWKFYVMNPDGTNERDLGLEPTGTELNDPCRADWSPDGRQFAFPVTRDGKRFLHVADADGSHVREIPDGRGLYPHWSRDGKKLVFFAANNLHSINLDGSARRQLTQNPPDAEVRPNYPQWSHDGRHIYFLRGSDVCRMNADGSDVTVIPTLPGMKWYLGLSARGQLAFGFIEEKRDCIYVLDPDGKNLRRIVP